MLKSMLGHNHAGYDEHKNHIHVFGPEPLLDNLKKITGKHLYDQQQAPNSCCRDVKNLDLEIYRSSPDVSKDDIYVLACKCGDRHRRFFVDPGAIQLFTEKKNG